MSYDLGIIGAGNMAEAIVRGAIGSGVLAPGQMLASDVSADRRELFERALGVRAMEDNVEAARQCRMLLLSVKPQQMQSALAGIGQAIAGDTLIISIAAGISTGYIERALGGGKPWRVVRTMPNTPMLVGQGMVAMAPGAHATREDMGRTRELFESAARVIEVNEEQLDAVTAVSGSGPAYFFFLIEQMIRAGVELGLSPEQAHELATQTAQGAATMMSASGEAPEELRRKVTSPNGTTHAAITHLQSAGWPDITVEAIKAACRRSRELGQ
jgi:pyrroline-5-carboxylate reductase